MKLTRFWFEFDRESLPTGLGIGLGCGVTAWNYDDAVNILKEKIFQDMPFPEINKLKENVDVSTLDEGHVLPNMLPTSDRGIWYPIGYGIY